MDTNPSPRMRQRHTITDETHRMIEAWITTHYQGDDPDSYAQPQGQQNARTLGWLHYAHYMCPKLNARIEDAEDGCQRAAVEIYRILIIQAMRRGITFSTMNEVEAFSKLPIVWSRRKKTFVELKPRDRICKRIIDVRRARTKSGKLIIASDRNEDPPELTTDPPDFNKLSGHEEAKLIHDAEQAFEAGISLLAPNRQTVVRLRLAGMGYQAIAEELSISPGAARQRMRHAKASLSEINRRLFDAKLKNLGLADEDADAS